MSNKRDQIIKTTCQLIELQGYHATGLNQILAESGAPKGSLYYYFPEGKEELVVAAIERTSREIERNMQQMLTAVPDPIAAINQFILGLAEVVEASGFRAGGPITAVAVEAASTSESLRLACRDAYRRWQEVIAARLRAGGSGDERAESLSVLIIAALEGAIILSRSQQDARPLRLVAAEIDSFLRGAGA